MLLPIASAVPFPAAAHADDRIVPPGGPMRYTRRLERTLGDNASFVVSRSYSVVFLPQPRGLRVEGQQIDVAISAPESLAAFVRLEREREELGLFPILLDDHGMIVGSAPDGESRQLDAAVREVSAELERRAFDPVGREELRQFASALQHQAGRMVTVLPPDLFAPAEPARRDSRQVSLPGGATGEVAVTFTAARDPVTKLMREATRVVDTSLSGGLRRTTETWRLEPLR
jgi:hypothetical protein